jgi:hyperosmotically inducible periplasmic protein
MIRTIASSAIALFLGLGCFGAPQDKSHNDAFMPGSVNESALARRVQHELLMLPYYTIFDDLALRVDDTTVTLLGAVTNPVLKSDAENVTKKVEGVTNVVNDIKVLPVSPMDSQIRRAELRAIYGDPQIGDIYGHQALPPIHIVVENGRVTLEGIVNSETDKSLINIRANQVPNVFQVTNNLIVASSGKK